MNTNSLNDSPVSRKMVRERAVELAFAKGRSAHEVSKSDWDQARQEMTSHTGVTSNEAVLEAAPESERWDPLPGSAGYKVPATPSADENEEGQSYKELLVETGVVAAEQDITRQASQQADAK